VAVGALAGAKLARWLGVALLALDAIDRKFFIGTYPLWSALIILFDVVGAHHCAPMACWPLDAGPAQAGANPFVQYFTQLR